MAASGQVWARLVVPADAERLAELFAAVDSDFFHPHPFSAAEAARIAGYRGRDAFAVLEAEGRLVAYGMLRGWDEGYEIPSLGIAVRRDAARRGYARRLMTWLADEAGRRGAPRIRLRVDAANRPARALYEALGYAYAGEERGELVMVRELSLPSAPG